MQTDDNEDSLLGEMAARHGVSPDAVRTVLAALKAGGGYQAQFSHPEFGGMCQWMSGGMTMVGDMFNNQLKYKLDGLAGDLATWLRNRPPAPVTYSPSGGQSQSQGMPGGAMSAGNEVSYRSGGSSSANWWPGDLGQPGSTGSQNSLRYAIFPAARRLAIDDNGTVTVYNTGDHQIFGVSQGQSGDQTITFTSQSGLVKVSELRTVVRKAAGKG